MAVHVAEQSNVVAVAAVNRIDHYVIQVNDLWRSFEFYRDVLGAQVDAIAGADIERLSHRGNQILFIRIAGHRGVGMAVSNVETPPATRMFEHYTVGFEVTDPQLLDLQALLGTRGTPYVGPNVYGPALPIARSLFFQDPDGHTIEACVRSTSSGSESEPRSQTGSGPVHPRRISHMRVEVTDVNRSARWFQDVLGFEPVLEHEREAYLKVRNGDQLLVLRPTRELSPWRDFVRGPHIDLEVPPAAYPAIFERIEDREGYWDSAPHPFNGPRGVDHNVTVYFFDPDGNRFQVSPAGSH